MNDFTQDPSINKLSTNAVFNKAQPDFLRQLPSMKRCPYIAEHFKALDHLSFVYEVNVLKALYAAQDRLIELIQAQLTYIDALSPIFSFDALAEHDAGIRWGIAAVLDIFERIHVQVLDVEAVVRGWLDGTRGATQLAKCPSYYIISEQILGKYVVSHSSTSLPRSRPCWRCPIPMIGSIWSCRSTSWAFS